MIRTRVGYTGGRALNPTYRHMGDHTETLQIDYDPTQISYEEILKIFWANHNPFAEAWSRQYMSAIFYHNDGQKEIAIATRDQHSAAHQRQIHTVLASAETFYLAEDYHQKFRLQQQADLMSEFQQIYPNFQELVNATAVARVNGHLAGYGSAAQLDQYGLSARAQQKIARYLK